MRKLYWFVFLIFLSLNAQDNEINLVSNISIDTMNVDSAEVSYQIQRRHRSDKIEVEEDENEIISVIHDIDIEELLGIELEEKHIGNTYYIDLDIQARVICTPSQIEVAEDDTESEIADAIKAHYLGSSKLFSIDAINTLSSQSKVNVNDVSFTMWTYESPNDGTVEHKDFEVAVSEAYLKENIEEPVLLSNEETVTIALKIYETDCGVPTYDLILEVHSDKYDHMVHTAIITEARCDELTDNDNIDFPNQTWIKKSRYVEVTDIARGFNSDMGKLAWTIKFKKSSYAINNDHYVEAINWTASFRENEINSFFRYHKFFFWGPNNCNVYIPSDEDYNGHDAVFIYNPAVTLDDYVTFIDKGLPYQYSGSIPDFVDWDKEYYRVKAYYLKIQIYNSKTKNWTYEVIQVPLPVKPVFYDNNFLDGYIYKNEGQSALLQVKAKGFYIKYQWYKNGQKIPYATKNILDIGKQFAENNGDQYYCIASNTIGETQSEVATISISDYPLITGYSIKNRTLTLSEGNDTFFPVSYLVPPKSNMLINWGDGTHKIYSRDDISKSCRTTNSCFWESYPHTYEKPGKYTVTVKYKRCSPYSQKYKTASINEIEIKPDMTPINMLLLD